MKSPIDPENPIPVLSDIREAAQNALHRADGEQIMQLKKALLPFARLLQDHNNWDAKGRAFPDDKPIFAINSTTITLGDLRRAYAAVVS